MSGRTNIEWATDQWNPIVGCSTGASGTRRRKQAMAKPLGKQALEMLSRFVNGPAKFKPANPNEPAKVMRQLVRRKLMWADRRPLPEHWEPMRYPGARDIGTWRPSGATEYWAGLTEAGRKAWALANR